jgi:hypothetical protein
MKRFVAPVLATLALSACGGAPESAYPGASRVTEAGYYPPGAPPPPSVASEPMAEAGSADLAAPLAGTPMVAPSEAPVVARAVAGVKAGEWDDNANYRDFLGYLANHAGRGIDPLDVSNRQFIAVTDAAGRGVPNCSLKITAPDRSASTRLTTLASGRAVLFPAAMGVAKGDGGKLAVSAKCGPNGAVVQGTIDAREPDGLTQLTISEARPDFKKPVVEVAFILDTTGSMSEEIDGVKDTLDKVMREVGGAATIRVGLVEYKDQGDAFVTKAYPFTTDLAAFRKQVDGIHASGGGDTPEDVNSGLAATLQELKWTSDSAARVAFLIADAPPHLDYPQGISYTTSAKRAASMGIKLHTISASGMDDVGQAAFRQIAQFTGGTNMFVLRGGAGPQSTGAGDAKSSCGGTHENFSSGNLDELILRKVKLEVAALRADPLQVAGRGQDENAKPCDKRILLVAD